MHHTLQKIKKKKLQAFYLFPLQVVTASDMSKIPRLPGDGAQADPDLDVNELSNKCEPHKINESRKSLHDIECGKCGNFFLCILHWNNQVDAVVRLGALELCFYMALAENNKLDVNTSTYY